MPRVPKESDLSRIKPHPTAKLAAIMIGGAAVVFAVIGGAIVLAGNDTFDVDPFGLGLSKPLSILLTPLIMFFGTYALTYALCSVLQYVFSGSTRPDEGP